MIESLQCPLEALAQPYKLRMRQWLVRQPSGIVQTSSEQRLLCLSHLASTPPHQHDKEFNLSLCFGHSIYLLQGCSCYRCSHRQWFRATPPGPYTVRTATMVAPQLSVFTPPRPPWPASLVPTQGRYSSRLRVWPRPLRSLSCASDRRPERKGRVKTSVVFSQLPGQAIQEVRNQRAGSLPSRRSHRHSSSPGERELEERLCSDARNHGRVFPEAGRRDGVQGPVGATVPRRPERTLPRAAVGTGDGPPRHVPLQAADARARKQRDAPKGGWDQVLVPAGILLQPGRRLPVPGSEEIHHDVGAPRGEQIHPVSGADNDRLCVRPKSESRGKIR